MNVKSIVTPVNVIAVEVALLLACAFVPGMFRASIESQADRVLADLRVVRAAAVMAHERNGAWPESAPAGTVPGSLRPFLPGGFEFDRGRYRLAWEHADLGPTADPSADAAFVGVSAVIADGRVSTAVVKKLDGKEFHFTVGDRTTLQLPAPAGDRAP